MGLKLVNSAGRDPGIPGSTLHPLAGTSLHRAGGCEEEVVCRSHCLPAGRAPTPSICQIRSTAHQPHLLEIFHQETNLDEIWAPRRKGWARLPHICLDFPLQMLATVLAHPGAYLRPIPSKSQLLGEIKALKMGSGKAGAYKEIRDWRAGHHPGVGGRRTRLSLALSPASK